MMKAVQKLGLVIIGSIFLCIFIYTTQKLENGVELKTAIVDMKEIDNVMTCLVHGFNLIQKIRLNFTEMWNRYSGIVQTCSHSLMTLLPIFPYRNRGETKYFLHPINPFHPLTVVTLGIGRDVKSEGKIKKNYNQTKFYGVDNDDVVSGKMYQEYLGGEFLKGIVGAQGGKYKASLLVGRHYQDVEEEHFSFKEVLKKFNIKDKIDLLLMDIESAEFDLFPEIIFNPKDYPIICQINVEFHSPKEHQDMIGVYYNMSVDGRYWYTYMINNFLDFHRSYFINVKDRYCLETYFGV